MSRMPKSQLNFRVFLLLALRLIAAVSGNNMDTDRPVLREVSGVGDGSLFGYSIVLHQTSANPRNLLDALTGARIVVSAPKGTVPGGTSVPRTGIVYSCPVNPGNCSPLSGKLSDTTPNSNTENKTDQFLGGSMSSNGERFVVCAPRYTHHLVFGRTVYAYPLGKCFYTTGRSLENFQQNRPCSTVTNSNFACQAGISSTIVSDGVNSYAFGVGAPGINYWTGALIRLTDGGSTNFQSTNVGSSFNDYQGYAVVGGNFLTAARQDFAVSLPRRNNYFGTVNLVANDNNLRVTSQPLAGMQMGEYYGFSLLAADLNGDGFDELLVGAPLYRANSTEPEAGRVFIYRNNMGNLRLLRTIEGRMRYSRFGYAMANLGDINGDGFDDVAISAPFTETGTSEPGTVFIYHSTPTLLLSLQPQQVIHGSDLRLSLDLTALRGFGTSLASGVDVDLNNYNDLAVGSFLSQKVFLLRTRPIARVQTTLTASPSIVDVMSKVCSFNGMYACFNLTVCVEYSGTGLANDLTFRLGIIGDSQSVGKRVFFEENRMSTISQNITAALDRESCRTFRTLIMNGIDDVFNPFVMDLSVNTLPRNAVTGNGNEILQDLSSFPVVTLTGATQIEVETLKECEGGVCVPDLRISDNIEILAFTNDGGNYTDPVITVGLTSTVDLFLTVENAGEDAFQSILSFMLPANVLDLVNIFNQTGRGEVSLRCSLETLEVLNQQFTRHNCSLGNPFSGPGTINLRVNLDPRNEIIGNEDDVLVNFTVSSINTENTTTIVDDSNFATIRLDIEARANITIDDGVVMPEQISYSDNATVPPNITISQLGPAVDVSFLIRSTGPSRIANIQLVISWPLNSTVTRDNYYLYVTSVQSSGAATVTCGDTYINPMMFQDDLTEGEEGQEPGGTVSMGGGGRRRRKRSTAKRTLRSKRQEDPLTEQDMSENRTLSCLSPSPILNCVNIQCNILGLAGPSSVQVDINARLDERFFSTNNDRYLFTPTASISIDSSSEFIKSNDELSERFATAQIRVIPAARIVIVGDTLPVPWWAILVPILAAVIVITVVTVLLWVFGFFRRKKHEEIKQRREELQTLEEHGVSPGGDNQQEYVPT